MQLELRLLGTAEVVVFGVPTPVRRQHALALLAFLALEAGWHSREQIAAMLWADADITSSQQNLRTVLAHLRDVLGDAAHLLETTRSKVQLQRTGVWVDALMLQNPPDHQLETVAKLYRQEFLTGLQLPDAPDVDAWLEQQREQVKTNFDAVLARLFEQQRAGFATLALETARRRVGLDSLNESAHQALIALLLEQGNRTAALEVYRVFERQLKTELGLNPSRETQALLEQIERQSDVVKASAEPFVARIEEWRWLEQAWRSGQRVLLRGEPGVGKTRLLREFARACGLSVWLEGRPGDQAVPFAAITRFLRAHSVMRLGLQAWVKTELQILLPELEIDSTTQPSKPRLFAALLSCIESISSHAELLVLDDWQFLDPSSLEFVFYLLEQSQLKIVATARSGELSLDTEAKIAVLVGAKRLVQIELPRLLQTDLESLLRGLGLDTSQAALLHKRTGGNPLYVLESLRAGTNPTQQLHQLIEARLERLSKPARDVARVAAILESDFGLELTAQMLEVRALELLEPIDELQQHGLMQDLRFAHDLVLETLRQAMPVVTRRWLHQRALSILETSQANPAVLAYHAIGAAKPVAVFGYSALAGARAVEVYAYAEALEHHQHALSALNQLSPDQLEERQLMTFFDAYATLLTQQSKFYELHTTLKEGIGLSQHWKFALLEGTLHNLLTRALLRAGIDFPSAEQAFLAALELSHNIPELRLDMLLTRHHLEGAKGDWLAAGVSARAAAQLAKEQHKPEVLQEALMGAMFAAQNLGAWNQVRLIAEEVRPISQAVGGRASLAHAWAVSGIASVYLGQPRRAIEEASTAFEALSSIGWGSGQRFAAQALTQAHAELGQLEAAFEQNASTVFHEHAPSRPTPYARSWWTRAYLYFLVQDHKAAHEALQHAKHIEVMPSDALQIQAAIASLECAIFMQQGNPMAALKFALEAAKFRAKHPLHGWTRWTPHWLELQALCLGGKTDLAEERFNELKLLETQNPRWQIEVLAARAELEALEHKKASLKTRQKAIQLAQELELPTRLKQLQERGS